MSTLQAHRSLIIFDIVKLISLKVKLRKQWKWVRNQRRKSSKSRMLKTRMLPKQKSQIRIPKRRSISRFRRRLLKIKLKRRRRLSSLLNKRWHRKNAQTTTGGVRSSVMRSSRMTSKKTRKCLPRSPTTPRRRRNSKKWRSWTLLKWRSSWRRKLTTGKSYLRGTQVSPKAPRASACSARNWSRSSTGRRRPWRRVCSPRSTDWRIKPTSTRTRPT